MDGEETGQETMDKMTKDQRSPKCIVDKEDSYEMKAGPRKFPLHQRTDFTGNVLELIWSWK